VVITAFIRDFLIGEADIASFSYYSKPLASAGGAFTLSFVILAPAPIPAHKQGNLTFDRGTFLPPL
jgi:hypothetical protein